MPTPVVINALTIDVEDYFHASALADVAPRTSWESLPSRVGQNTRRLLDTLDRAGVRGTCFVLGWVARRDPALVKDIAARGHEIASHGFWHQLVYDQTPDEFRADVRDARARLQDISGQAVLGYRAPSFSIVDRSLWALDVLVEEGYRYDASIFPIHHDRYGIPDAPRAIHIRQTAAGPIAEVPSSTVRVGKNLPTAGGGYFRLLPYAWTRWGIQRVNAEGMPAIFYLHPWEVDPGQPVMPLSRLTTFRHYHNLDKCEARLERMMRDFPFGPLGDIVSPYLNAAVPDGTTLATH
jgi:polysaccharide deacetylase family protein (PEP-CTERM system associated)